MGSPVSPVVANLFEHFEEILLGFWKRFEDEVFASLKTMTHFNSVFSSIQFASEVAVRKCSLVSVCRKLTHTDR